ncbi:MAG: electron transfer flavoprotein subunit alpha/FixB family protein [Halomonas sp.]|nr:electron transfer flavoprotein subunit alpha/FixB family protein [Halomonas sp.]
MSEMCRRDPRREWIARNRLHPEHASALIALGRTGCGGAASEWPGPNGVLRRNPHGVGFIGPNGIKRIDRSGTQQGGQAAGGVRQASQDSRRRVEIPKPAFLVAVVPDLAGGRLSGHDKELAECAEPVDETRHAAEPLALAIEPPVTLSRIEDLGQVAVDPAGVALAEAEFILAGGNGVRDWDGFHHAARVLGATEGASRVSVDDGFMARDRQVGASGTWVTARVYLAVGISGAIQHLQGIQGCDRVVAINLDPGCDMIKRADLAVIGEAADILAALVAKVEQQRGGQRDAA